MACTTISLPALGMSSLISFSQEKKKRIKVIFPTPDGKIFDHKKAMELSIIYPNENPVELPDGLEMKNLTPDEMLQSMTGPFLGKDMEGGGRGSNAWAISSKLTSKKGSFSNVLKGPFVAGCLGACTCS